MRTIVIAVFLLVSLITSPSWAFDYDLKDALIERTDENGNKSYAVNINIIDYYINEIAKHAIEYPPRFSSKQEQDDIVFNLTKLLKLLEIIGENQQNNPDFLFKAAFANSMGHNLNLKGSDQKSKYYFEKLLSIDPNSQLGNYHYGMFLAGTNKYHFDSIQYLEKSLMLGNQDARYTLGLLYVQKGEMEKGLGLLNSYSNDNPNNEKAKKVISAINSNKLEFKSN